MDEKNIREFINAIGLMSETSLIFFRNAIKAGATTEEAIRLVQAFLTAMMFGPGKKTDNT